jgi:hypothetical protein
MQGSNLRPPACRAGRLPLNRAASRHSGPRFGPPVRMSCTGDARGRSTGGREAACGHLHQSRARSMWDRPLCSDGRLVAALRDARPDARHDAVLLRVRSPQRSGPLSVVDIHARAPRVPPSALVRELVTARRPLGGAKVISFGHGWCCPRCAQAKRLPVESADAVVGSHLCYGNARGVHRSHGLAVQAGPAPGTCTLAASWRSATVLPLPSIRS